jgi:hypothetical protein
VRYSFVPSGMVFHRFWRCRSPYPQPIGTSSAQQQQRLTGNSVKREPLSDIPVQGTTDTKRIKR